MRKHITKKRDQEKQTIRFMIDLYCHKHHKEHPCQECEDLYAYASKRIEHCPFMETKTFCSSCKVHCYRKEQRDKIKEVMRFSGPYMLLYHPLMALRHMINTSKQHWEKRKTKGGS